MDEVNEYENDDKINSDDAIEKNENENHKIAIENQNKEQNKKGRQQIAIKHNSTNLKSEEIMSKDK